jgi:hypothetical protein
MLADTFIVFVLVTGTAFLLGRWQQDRSFLLLMIGYGAVLSLATILSLQSSTAAGPWNAPYLAGSDGEGYFVQARLLAEEGVLNYQALIRSNYLGYQILLAILFTLFGTSLLVGVVANDFFLLLTAVCLYRATLLLTGSPRAALLACVAFALTTANIFYGLVLLKEPALGLAFGLVLLALTKTVTEDRASVRAFIYLLVALVIIISMRATVLLFLFILFAFVANLLVKRRAHVLAALVGLVVLSAPLAQYFTIYDLNTEYLAQQITSNTVISSRFEQGDLDVSGVAGSVAGILIPLPFVAKMALFPVPTAMQILLPFDVWSTQFAQDHFSMLFLKNLNIIWLLFVAPWTVFSIVNIRHIRVPVVGRLALAGTCYYIAVAVIYSGLIPRYGSLALIFIFPALGYWWARAREDPEIGGRARRFFSLYYAIAAVAALGFIALQFIRLN